MDTEENIEEDFKDQIYAKWNGQLSPVVPYSV